MEYPVRIAGFEGRQIVVKSGGLFSGAKLLVDGQPAPKGEKRGELLLRRNDGTDVPAQLRMTNFLDPVPVVVINGEQIHVVEPLKWYEWVWAGSPILLVFAGGLLGGLTGGVAAVVNGRILRSQTNTALKYAITGLISFSAVITYLVLAVVFGLLTRGM